MISWGGIIILRHLRTRAGFIHLSAICLLFSYHTCLLAQHPVINEFMSLNCQSIADEDGDYSDWIEIYNPTTHAISLLGYGLSDDPSEPFKWQIPNVSLEANGFKVIFASGKNRFRYNHELHTNFRIDSEGEELILTSPSGNIINHIPSLELDSDISYARVPDASVDWYTTGEVSPGTSNGTSPPLPRAAEPEFSIPGGIYSGGISVELISPLVDAAIYYSVDGSIPDEGQFLYLSPISIDTSTVIRARVFHPDYASSAIKTVSYILNSQHTLPVVSVVTDPGNLWDWETGIYVLGPNAEPEFPYHGANFYEDWRINGEIEVFTPDNQTLISQDIEIEIYGGVSRSYPQKSLKILSGTESFNYQFFKDIPIFSFDAFVLRNSGNDWYHSMLRDGFVSTLADGLGFAHQGYLPTVVYLNGVYWGIHNLRERIDHHYLEDHYGADPEDIVIVKQWNISDYGTAREFRLFMNSLEEADLESQEAYQEVIDFIDIENFIRYWSFQIISANIDWPRNNIRCWNGGENGRYQWILYDTDMSYGLMGIAGTNNFEWALDPDSEHWSNYPRSTLLFRKLVENQTFREHFIVRFCDILNMTFNESRQFHILDSLAIVIEDEIPIHQNRWDAFEDNWEESLEDFRYFITHRKNYVLEHLTNQFQLNETATITLSNTDMNAGRIWLNAFPLGNNETFTGQYATEYAIKVWAECYQGYEFDGWSGSISSQDDTLFVDPVEGLHIAANFEETPVDMPRVIINEINYNCEDCFDSEDWIELVTLETEVDISNWILKDNQDDNIFIIPEGTILDSTTCLVLSREEEAFSDCFPNCSNVIGDFDFGLSADGDQIRLYDQNGNLIDSVSFSPYHPWPAQANGKGSTLQLIQPGVDNSKPHNWLASRMKHGSPGSLNCLSVSPPEGTDSTLPEKFGITNVYPNPFNDELTIEFVLKHTDNFMLDVYNIQGQLVQRYSYDNCVGNVQYRIHLNAEGLSSGIYFISGKTSFGEAPYNRRITLIK